MRHIITIVREFGNGGRELGRRLSDELQIAYYDQEIISEVAKRTALSEAYVGQFEETRPIMVYPIHVCNSFLLHAAPFLPAGHFDLYRAAQVAGGAVRQVRLHH